MTNTRKPEKWWERNSRLIYSQRGLISQTSHELGPLIFEFTHGEHLKEETQPFWIGPNDELEFVDEHFKRPEEYGERGSFPTHKGWIRGRISKIPKWYLWKISKGRDTTTPADFEDIPLINVYSEHVEDFTSNSEILERLIRNIDRITIDGKPLESETVISVMHGTDEGTFIGTLSDIRSRGITGNPSSLIQKFHTHEGVKEEEKKLNFPWNTPPKVRE
jgi:hypothetical protein